MNYKSLLSNFSIAIVAQATALLLGFVLSLIVPKVLNVTEYGYWQLFSFYIGYVGIFHFGLNDGVYLINGGRTRDTIDKKSIGSQFWFGLLFQSIIAIAIVAVAILGPFESDRAFVLVAVAVFLLFNNATLFLGYLFQAMNETKLFSYSTAINNLAFLPVLLILSFLNVHDFRIYVLFYICAKILAFIFCAINAREFLLSKRKALTEAARESFGSIRVGSKLLIANLASMLLLGMLQFLIDYHWGIETFGKLSFALSLVSLFQVFVAQASMVLFPALRQTDSEEIVSFFLLASLLLGFLFPIIYILYFPMAAILNLWLPQYAESLELFGLLLPICLFESRMDLIGFTYLKVLRKERNLLIINCAATTISAVGVAISIFAFESITMAVLSVVITIACRSVFTEHYIRKTIKAPADGMAICMSIISIAFVVMHLLLPPWMTCCGAVVMYALFLLIQHKRIGEAKELLKRASS